jgi:hypothetical protein
MNAIITRLGLPPSFGLFVAALPHQKEHFLATKSQHGYRLKVCFRTGQSNQHLGRRLPLAAPEKPLDVPHVTSFPLPFPPVPRRRH